MTDNPWIAYIDQLDEEDWQKEYPNALPWYIYLFFIIIGVTMVYLGYFTNLFNYNPPTTTTTITGIIYLMAFAIGALVKYLLAPLCGLLGFLSLPLMFIALCNKHKSI